MKRASWVPLLRGRAAAEAREVVDDIARALAAYLRTTAPDPSLAKGAAGIALLAGHLDQPRLLNAAVRAALQAHQRQPLPSLHLGAPGVAYVLRTLGADAPLDEMDARVGQMLEAIDPRTGRIDLLRGVVGLAVYLLPRAADPVGAAGLTRAIDILAAAAIPAAGGLAWRYHPDNLATEIGQQHEPEGFLGIGLAEGACGVAALLAHVHASGFMHPRTRELLTGALTFVRANRTPDARHACFPIAADGAAAGLPARTSWCLGDLGVAVALWHAGHALDDRETIADAVNIAHTAAQRAAGDTGIVDAGLCHGTAGAAHIFARFHQWTRDAVFATAARNWYARTLGMRGRAFGVAGYASLVGSPVGQAWEDEPGLLRGAAGIALALHAATTREDPAWDRVLLVT
ncbi:MAG: lanthionine synthetase C family protein [Deltaproteobacteria bacterium]|nr:lanthionine synthetase C family protein [Deltaproteobacteria bacterium]